METEQLKPTLPQNEDEPQVFTVVRDVNASHYDRRQFIEKAAVASAATTIVVSGCSFVPKPVNTQATVDAAIAATDTFKKAVIAAEEATRASKPTDTPVPAATATPTTPPTDTPVPPTKTPNASPTPSGINTTIKGDNVNFRAGPGTGYSTITRLPSGTQVLVTSRLADSTWVGVALRDPKKKDKMVEGWIKTSLIETRGVDIKSLPVITEIPPTPTPLPGKYGKTGAGQTGMDYEYTDQYGNTYPYNMACGSALPAGAVCTCNCVTVPRSCSCNNNTGCGCDDLHYWYPN